MQQLKSIDSNNTGSVRRAVLFSGLTTGNANILDSAFENREIQRVDWSNEVRPYMSGEELANLHAKVAQDASKYPNTAYVLPPDIRDNTLAAVVSRATCGSQAFVCTFRTNEANQASGLNTISQERGDLYSYSTAPAGAKSGAGTSHPSNR